MWSGCAPLFVAAAPVSAQSHGSVRARPPATPRAKLPVSVLGASRGGLACSGQALTGLCPKPLLLAVSFKMRSSEMPLPSLHGFPLCSCVNRGVRIPELQSQEALWRHLVQPPVYGDKCESWRSRLPHPRCQGGVAVRVATPLLEAHVQVFSLDGTATWKSILRVGAGRNVAPVPRILASPAPTFLLGPRVSI